MAQSQYAQIADLESLAITVAAGTRFGDTAMTAALQAASSIADSYITSQFTLPLQTAPAQGWDMSLTLHVSNIAAWLLYNQFGYSPMAPGDDLVVKRYQSALDWLAMIRDQKIHPQWLDSSGDSVQTEQGPFVISDPPVGFTTRGVTSDSGSADPWGGGD